MSSLSRMIRITILSITVLTFISAGFAFGDIDDTIRKSFSVDSGGTLKLDTDTGSIEVRGTSGRTLEIEVFRKVKTNNQKTAQRILDNFHIDFEQSGNDIYITGDRQRKANFWDNIWNRLRVKYIIHVPEVYNIDLRTSGGSISVEVLEGEVNVRTSGGSLDLDDITGPVWGKTSGGSIRVGNINGDVDIDTSGGSIKAHISKQPDSDCRLTTSGGGVTVYLTRNIAVDLDASTSGGSVHTEFPVTIQGKIDKRKLKSKINGGGPLLTLHTSGGSIYIKEF